VLKNPLHKDKPMQITRGKPKFGYICKKIKMSEIIPSNKSETKNQSQFRLFIDMMRNHFNKTYTGMSQWTILWMVVGIVYAISPIDLIPDIPIIGYIDDAVVLGFVLTQVKKEIVKYQTWKSNI
jgi:uncharacterized membrane protein YkvA (DUF1232 family)